MKEKVGVKPSAVGTDPRVQRPLDPKRVHGIAGNLNMEAIGVPVVSQRPDGTLVALDGQHRISALVVAGKGDEELEMIRHQGLSLEQEAELFRLLNNTKRPGALDLFRIAVTEGSLPATAVDAIISKNGFTSEPGHPHSLSAVRTAEHLYGLDAGTTLDRTLYVCNGVWGAARLGVHTTILSGVGGVLFRFSGAVDLSRLVDKLKRDSRSSDPARFVGRVRTTAEVNGSKKPDAAAGLIITIYNKHLQEDGGRALPSWQ